MTLTIVELNYIRSEKKIKEKWTSHLGTSFTGMYGGVLLSVGALRVSLTGYELKKIEIYVGGKSTWKFKERSFQFHFLTSQIGHFSSPRLIRHYVTMSFRPRSEENRRPGRRNNSLRPLGQRKLFKRGTRRHVQYWLLISSSPRSRLLFKKCVVPNF